MKRKVHLLVSIFCLFFAALSFYSLEANCDSSQDFDRDSIFDTNQHGNNPSPRLAKDDWEEANNLPTPEECEGQEAQEDPFLCALCCAREAGECVNIQGNINCNLSLIDCYFSCTSLF